MSWYSPDNQVHVFSLRLVLSRLVTLGDLELLKVLADHLHARQMLAFDDVYKDTAREASRADILAYLNELTF